MTFGDQRDGRRHTFDDRRGVGGELLRRKTEACCGSGIDLKAGGWTADCVLESIEHIDDTLLLLDCVSDSRSNIVENLGTGIKELDLDRLGSVGEVTDHVLQDLREFNVQLWLAGFDLRAEVRDDLIDAAVALAFELHSDIAGIGFGNCSQAHLQSCAARGALDLGGLLKHLLYMPQNAICLWKRTAC